ncbi:carbamoyl-phosphate synthase small subunit [Acutalibacter sp. 1XD8-33]|uniref:carbamoyl phosphate synthase small subunit n=1 Tax=Acutalibacter sp. 1XD8-33 TaxID=2320081 RepID=UPI000EA3F7A1|nr:carbamoyl phosphate synthase small subunit [Acutalibacter sp. 1XD8-33]RKJ42121.1 carbamoyl-phosphate synthase small subunit [Acutalibacter sp. 1XD8-33]
MGKTAYLVLENGRVFQGRRFGADGELTAEVVFTTGMTGYLETLTDPSYWGQIVVQTFPLIGNYGVIPSDFESGMIGPGGYIVKHWCQAPSNFRSEGSLDAFFKEKGLIALEGIDTRTLTKIIREKGVMNGAIADDPAGVDLEALRACRTQKGAVRAVSTKEKYLVGAENTGKRIALMDYGTKRNIAGELAKRGARVTVCPCDTRAEEIAAMGVDGIMLSNGPGDPAENVELIADLREIQDLGKPMFGICLGHQLLALAHGCRTEKLKYGHRGENQPVKNLETGRVYITSQNHGYAVVGESIDPSWGRELYRNVNDGTCEGVRYTDCPAFTTQFHPEACGGPLDTEYLFDEFFAMMD